MFHSPRVINKKVVLYFPERDTRACFTEYVFCHRGAVKRVGTGDDFLNERNHKASHGKPAPAKFKRVHGIFHGGGVCFVCLFVSGGVGA